MQLYIEPFHCARYSADNTVRAFLTTWKAVTWSVNMVHTAASIRTLHRWMRGVWSSFNQIPRTFYTPERLVWTFVIIGIHNLLAETAQCPKFPLVTWQLKAVPHLGIPLRFVCIVRHVKWAPKVAACSMGRKSRRSSLDSYYCYCVKVKVKCVRTAWMRVGECSYGYARSSAVMTLCR